MSLAEKPSVVDSAGKEIGRLGSAVGENYLAVERGNVTWFVPTTLFQHEPLGPSRIELSPEAVRKLDLFEST